MSRDLDPDNLAASTADTVSPVLFVELQFDGGTEYAHTRIGTITWGGHEWLGIGILGSVSAVEETSDLSRRTVTYTLSGIPNDNVSAVLNEHTQGRTAKLYLGFLDLVTNTLVATPELLDQGRLDVPEIEQGREFAVSITAESRFSSWERPVVRRYNNADQQARHPGDKFFEYIEQAASRLLVWGQAS